MKQDLEFQVFTCLRQKTTALRLSRVPLYDFSNLFGRPKNKNLSLSPFNGEGHQNRSTTLTGFRPIPHDVQGVAGKNKTVPILMFLQRKEKYQKTLKYCFEGAVYCEFSFFAGGPGK